MACASCLDYPDLAYAMEYPDQTFGRTFSKTEQTPSLCVCGEFLFCILVSLGFLWGNNKTQQFYPNHYCKQKHIECLRTETSLSSFPEKVKFPELSGECLGNMKCETKQPFIDKMWNV